MIYHDAVLLHESVEALQVKKNGVYVDVTFGGGGHTRKILEEISAKGHVFAFDQDGDAAENVQSDKRLTFIRANFRHLKAYLDYYGVPGIDGVLADLGVSSWQFDNPERGFSYLSDERLDMRMNREQSFDAADLLRTYSEEQLLGIFSGYGEVRNAKTLARRITAQRAMQEIRTVGQLLQIVDPIVMGKRMRYLSQVFQAIRIAVNDELGALAEMLEGAMEMLKPGARLVVISYHSIEDRVVKRFMKTGNTEGIRKTDDFGRQLLPLKTITKKPMLPSANEIERNIRARSAKMRVAEKI